MKKIKWIMACLAVLLLVGCANSEMPAVEQEKVNWEMNETKMQMIMDAIGCNDRRAKAMLEIFQEVQMAEPVSAVPVEDGSNSLIVETADGGKYEVGVNKKFHVYSIRDLTTGEGLYMVID